MSTYINTNTTAYMASLNLDANTSAESTDIERLSTGLKINSAADNPAGLVTVEDESAQLAGLNQATSNTNDAINLTQTAEGALNQVQTLLISMRALAVSASQTGTNNTAELAADQAQITSAIQSINNISSTTQFNNSNLLNGAATSAATVYNPSLASIASASSGAAVLQAGTWDGATNVAVTGALTATAATTQVSTSATAVVGAQSFTGSVVIGGTTYNVGGSTTVTLAQLNATIQASGYAATVAANKLVLTATTAGAAGVIGASTLAGDATAAGDVDTNATSFGAFTTTTAGNNATLAIAGGPTSTTSSTTNGVTTYIFGGTTGTGLVVSTNAGAAGSVGTLTSTTAQTTSGNSLEFQIGANAGQTVLLNIQSTAANQLGTGAAAYTNAAGQSVTPQTANVANINVTTFQGAQDAIAVLDQAINQTSAIRANLGAFQTNVLQSNATSLGVATTNLRSAQATVEDTDMAAQVVDYTKNSILVQAATSALTYANQEPQSILKLLQ
jgi:flagellin